MRGAVWIAAAIALTLFDPLKASAQDDGGWDYKPMVKALHGFADPLRGPYMMSYPPLVSEEILEGLSGPSYPAVELPGGRKLVSGCRMHSCDEKAAVILTPAYKVEAAAVIGSHCHWTKPPHRTRRGNLNGPSKCDSKDDILTVFVRKSPRADELDQVLRDWARRVDPHPLVNFQASAEPKAMPHEIVWLK